MEQNSAYVTAVGNDKAPHRARARPSSCMWKSKHLFFFILINHSANEGQNELAHKQPYINTRTRRQTGRSQTYPDTWILLINAGNANIVTRSCFVIYCFSIWIEVSFHRYRIVFGWNPSTALRYTKKVHKIDVIHFGKQHVGVWAGRTKQKSTMETWKM